VQLSGEVNIIKAWQNGAASTHGKINLTSRPLTIHSHFMHTIAFFIEKNDMNSIETDRRESNTTSRQGWYFLYAFIIVLTAIDLVKWDGDFVYYNNYHCYIVGFIIWLVYITRTQSIIDDNLFLKYSLLAAVPACILSIKMLLTTFTIPALLAILFPIIYLIVLRFYLFLYFSEYQNAGARPIHVSYTRTGVYWEGKEIGYIPTRADKRFSIWTDISIYLLMTVVIVWALLYNP
jgi:hypothetical protein